MPYSSLIHTRLHLTLDTRRYCTHLTAALLLALAGTPCIASMVTATNVTGFKRDASGGATWVGYQPTPSDTLTWTSGVNTTDEGVHSRITYGPEPKFSFTPPFPAGLGFKGRTFTGFSRTDTGLCGSTSITRGFGNSSFVNVALPVVGTVVGVPTAIWTLDATGTLGTPCIDVGGTNKLLKAEWESQATGNDPYSLTAGQLDDLPGPLMDLFFEVSLDEGEFSERGGIGLDVSFETAGGLLNLLDIDLTADGVTVTGDNAPGLSIYHLSDLTEGPTEDVDALVNFNDIRALLQADVMLDRSIDTPLILGFVLSDLPIPTIDLGDGTVAKIAFNTNAFDAADTLAQVPAPATLLLTAPVLVLLLFTRTRRRLEN